MADSRIAERMGF